MATTAQHPLAVLGLAPRGLSRIEAAAYIGISPSLFDDMVRDGRMPQPKPIERRVVWDRLQLDTAFAALPSRPAPSATHIDDNPWQARL